MNFKRARVAPSRTLNGLRRLLAPLFAFLLFTVPVQRSLGENPTQEEKTARFFDSVLGDENRLRMFLAEMPKGADLHNHLAGAVYAETYIQLAAADGLCVDGSTYSFVPAPCNPATGTVEAAKAYSDPDLYAHLIDAFSMRHFDSGRESGHDHFFATFPKFYPAAHGHMGEMIAEARAYAARDHVQYLELMITPDDGAPALGSKAGWSGDMSRMREQLLSAGLAGVVKAAREELDQAESKSSEVLRCKSQQAEPGCAVSVRYLYQVLRGLPPQQVFAQILTGFELAKTDPRWVGLNLVMPEDAYVPMHDFNLHMQMLDQLAHIYPQIPITLHAGELTPRLVPPEGLFHIRASIEKGHARRIGHGVDVLRESNPQQLLKLMAHNRILVEICLTSNDEILGVRDQEHPLGEYLRAGVPVALATDDEGVSRSDLTTEFLRAVRSYGLTYRQLKEIVRNSLHYSFLQGASLWRDDKYAQHVPECGSNFGVSNPSEACSSYLKRNQRAHEQWNLEQAFRHFESSRGREQPNSRTPN